MAVWWLAYLVIALLTFGVLAMREGGTHAGAVLVAAALWPLLGTALLVLALFSILGLLFVLFDPLSGGSDEADA